MHTQAATNHNGSVRVGFEALPSTSMSPSQQQHRVLECRTTCSGGVGLTQCHTLCHNPSLPGQAGHSAHNLNSTQTPQNPQVSKPAPPPPALPTSPLPALPTPTTPALLRLLRPPLLPVLCWLLRGPRGPHQPVPGPTPAAPGPPSWPEGHQAPCTGAGKERHTHRWNMWKVGVGGCASKQCKQRCGMLQKRDIHRWNRWNRWALINWNDHHYTCL